MGNTDQESKPSFTIGQAVSLTETLDTYFSNRPTFRQVLEITQEQMQQLGGAANALLQKKEYQKAADAFLFLTVLDPTQHSYWLNLGLAEELSGNYDNALHAFGMATLTDLSDPAGHIYAAECYTALDKFRSALDALQLAVGCGDSKEEFAAIRPQVLDLTKKIQEGQAAHGNA